MKKTCSFMLLSFFMIFLFAHCSSDRNSPEAVAEKFITSMLKGDFEKASKYCTEESLPLLNMAASAMSFQNQTVKSTFESVTCEVDDSGEKAVCQVQVLENGEPSTQNLDMVKIDGKWKAILSKSKN